MCRYDNPNCRAGKGRWFCGHYIGEYDPLCACGSTDSNHGPNAFAGALSGIRTSVINRGLPRRQQEAVIAHEIGHIEMGHTDGRLPAWAYGEPLVDEYEADAFAVEAGYGRELVAFMKHELECCDPDVREFWFLRLQNVRRWLGRYNRRG